MKLPLEKRLRKRMHVQIGSLQDEAMDVLYSISDKFTLHGGTAIWRCYGGGRFSEDIDLYATKLPDDFETTLADALKSRALQLQKFKKTQNLIFCKISSPEAEIRLEINFSANVKAVPIPFEKIDGSSMIVLCLSVDDLIIEKANAYISRKLIRDIYDVYFLLPKITDAVILSRLKPLVQKFLDPFDEDNLKAIIYSGAIPTYAQMHNYLMGHLK
ncbi:MAG: nucleotidyl transferase AbiEii/AbiGii toxin family protein [Candidatus Micrarchaeota archaeon]